MHKNDQVHSLQYWMPGKIAIIWKKASSKSCLELNSLQKSQRAHMSTSPRSGVRGLQWLIWLKYYNVQKRQITFTLWLDTAKNTDYMEKTSDKSCLELNFLQKSQWAHMSTFPQSGTRGLQRLMSLKYYNVEKWGSIDSLEGSMLPKICIISKNGSHKSYWALNSVQESRWARMCTSL